MSEGESTIEPVGSVAPLHTICDATRDEHAASMVDLLQEHLKLVREGKLRSIAVVCVSEGGAGIGTQWFGLPSDITTLIGRLTVLTHDLMSARR